MSRVHALVAHPRRTVGALAVVLTAVGVTVGSGANFTAQSANPSNTFTAGTLSIGNSQSSAILSAPNIKPGDTVDGTVDIQNSGSIAAHFTVKTTNPSDSTPSLLGLLDLKILDCGVHVGAIAPTCTGATEKYSGKVNGISTPVALGEFAASVKHRYRFEVTMPSSAGDSYQGKTASVSFNWDAVSS